MDIEYKGANCVVVKTKKGVLIVDPTKDITIKKDTIVLATQPEFSSKNVDFVIDTPGEYEVRDVSINGIAMKRYGEENSKNVAYRASIDGARIAIIGHIEAPISDDDLETIGVVDIVIIPVSGDGYTLDARAAAAVVRQISPKIVIPTCFSDKTENYDPPKDYIELFEKEMGGMHEKVSSLRIKNGIMPETLTVYEITKS